MAQRIPRDIVSLGFAATVGLLLLGGILGYRHAERLFAQRRMVAHTLVVAAELESLLATVTDAETGQRGYLLTEDEKYLAPHDEVTRQVQESLDRLEELTADNAQQQSRLVVLKPQISARLESLAGTAALLTAGDRQAAIDAVRTDRGKALMDDVHHSVAVMKNAERQLVSQRTDESDQSYRTLIGTIVLTTIAGLALVGLLYALHHRALQARQRAADRIAQQREQLQVTLASIGDAVIATDATGRVTFLNHVAYELTGWPEAEAQGLALEEVFRIVNEDTRQPVENPALRALNERAIVGLANHTVLIAKDGTERAIDDSAAPIRNRAGLVQGAILVFRDVTEQRRAARQLAESEARKTAMMDTALDCIITCDHAGVILEFNDAAERTFGYRRDDVVGREMSDIIVPPSMRHRHQQGMARYLRTGQSRILGQRLVMTGFRADGTEFPVEFSVNRIPTDDQPLFTAYLRDLTAVKEAELAAAEVLRHATLDAEIGVALTGGESMGDMLQSCAESLVRNLDGAFARIWLHNPARSMLELRASAGLYTHLDGPHGNVAVGQFKIGTIAQTREPHLTNAVIGDPLVPEQEWAQREGMVAFAGYPLVVKDRLIGVLAMFARQPLSPATLTAMESAARAIALGIERMKMEEQLRQVAADLSEADRRKDEFLALLAHELRNPLAPIRTGLQLMRLADGQPDVAEQARAVMERQVAQLVRLVDDLMDVSRITRGKLELRKLRIELAEVVDDAVETSRPLIEEMGHALTVELPDSPLMVDADRTRLAQVLLNLLNNAAKYSERGGRISLIAQRLGSDVVITVKDTGIGIDAQELPRIFQLFTQVDLSLEKSQGGLGIGLTLVKRLVEMHGGSIEAKSEGPGQGSEFIVRLPIAAEELEPSPADRAGDSAIPKSSLRVLIVDDNLDGAASLAMMLRILGHETRTAHDGQEGVAVAEHFRPDVILLDIGLPKLNGYEACRRIRAQPWGPEIALIAVTGWGQEEDRRRSHEAGFDQHMVKPVDPQALMRVLGELSATQV